MLLCLQVSLVGCGSSTIMMVTGSCLPGDRKDLAKVDEFFRGLTHPVSGTVIDYDCDSGQRPSLDVSGGNWTHLQADLGERGCTVHGNSAECDLEDVPHFWVAHHPATTYDPESTTVPLA